LPNQDGFLKKLFEPIPLQSPSGKPNVDAGKEALVKTGLRTRLDSYFQHQVYLSATEPNFLCPEDCNAPGCSTEDIAVEATLFDLIRLSLVFKTPVSILFSHHCRLGLQDFEFNPRYKILLVKLKKPCHFFQENRCMVHDSKPLNCVLFPEYHQITGLLPELSKRRAFSTFPCLKGPITVADKRSKALKKLRRISLREEALSCYLIFGVPVFIVDLKPLTKQLKRDNPKSLTFSVQAYDRLLVEKLKQTGLLKSIMDVVSKLDTRPGIESLFKKLGDDALMKPLLEKMVRPEIVHRFKGNSIKQLKRSLQRPEIAYM
jgi:Fe-S-cluster containining protein